MLNYVTQRSSNKHQKILHALKPEQKHHKIACKINKIMKFCRLQQIKTDQKSFIV